jgi:hypothetical protein
LRDYWLRAAVLFEAFDSLYPRFMLYELIELVVEGIAIGLVASNG